MSETPRTDAFIEALEREYDWSDTCENIDKREAFAKQLERELTAAQKDAERYRWMRDAGASIMGIDPIRRNRWLDAAIDAAIAAENSNPPA